MNSKIGASFNFGIQDVESELHNLKDMGYDYLELGVGLGLPIKVYEDKLSKFKSSIPILTTHLPQMDYKKEEIEVCKKFIELLSDRGVHLFVIHLYSINLPTKDNLELKINALHDLADFAKDKDLVLTLENTEEEKMTLKKVFGEIPNIDFCLDIGHANILPYTKENQSINLIQTFSNRLKHIHIHDNLGGDSEKHDLHLPVGEGNIMFKPIFQKLKEMKYTGNITVEFSHTAGMEDKKLNIKRVREFF